MGHLHLDNRWRRGVLQHIAVHDSGWPLWADAHCCRRGHDKLVVPHACWSFHPQQDSKRSKLAVDPGAHSSLEQVHCCCSLLDDSVVSYSWGNSISPHQRGSYCPHCCCCCCGCCSWESPDSSHRCRMMMVCGGFCFGYCVPPQQRPVVSTTKQTRG